MAIIEVRDLVKRYGDFTAVNGISFEVQEGEIFGIVGPNGAGKTTTLEIVETLKPPDLGPHHHRRRRRAARPVAGQAQHRRAVTTGPDPQFCLLSAFCGILSQSCG